MSVLLAVLLALQVEGLPRRNERGSSTGGQHCLFYEEGRERREKFELVGRNVEVDEGVTMNPSQLIQLPTNIEGDAIVQMHRISQKQSRGENQKGQFWWLNWNVGESTGARG